MPTIENQLHPDRFEALMRITEGRALADVSGSQFSQMKEADFRHRLELVSTLFQVRESWAEAGSDVEDVSDLLAQTAGSDIVELPWFPNLDCKAPCYLHFGAAACLPAGNSSTHYIDGVYVHPTELHGEAGAILYYVCNGSDKDPTEMTLSELLAVQTRIVVGFLGQNADDVVVLDGDPNLVMGTNLDIIHCRVLLAIAHAMGPTSRAVKALPSIKH